jgi:hypothetical protein
MLVLGAFFGYFLRKSGCGSVMLFLARQKRDNFFPR